MRRCIIWVLACGLGLACGGSGGPDAVIDAGVAEETNLDIGEPVCPAELPSEDQPCAFNGLSCHYHLDPCPICPYYKGCECIQHVWECAVACMCPLEDVKQDPGPKVDDVLEVVDAGELSVEDVLEVIEVADADELPAEDVQSGPDDAGDTYDQMDNGDPCTAVDLCEQQCVPVEPYTHGICGLLLGVIFDGEKCVNESGCSCEPDCEFIFPTLEACEEACKAPAACVTDDDCDDDDLCTLDICAPDTGECSNPPMPPMSCECTGDPTCDPETGVTTLKCDECTWEVNDPITGDCKFVMKNCDDSDSCTIDSCDPEDDDGDPCQHEPIPDCQPEGT